MVSVLRRDSLFKKVAAFLLLSLSLLWAAPVVNFKGSMGVSQGTLNYTVDLQLPPGVAGVVPKLSLLYSSSGGNGYLGQGWNLTGLSSISRCGSTIAEDGIHRDIRLDEKDHYCLDGQRLIAINGTEGAGGTEYRTKIEGFSKIVSYGGTLGNPEKFKVWTKSGDIYEYGFTADSKFTHEGKHVSWKLNRIKDALQNSDDNTIDFAYDEQAILSVTYARGINQIKFNYTKNRKDIRKSNFRGTVITQERELASIDINVNENTQRQYVFGYYDQSSTHDRLKLESMTACRGSECLEPLTFEWQTYDHEHPSFTHQDTNIDTSASYKMKVADFNGDGYADVLRLYEDNAQVWLNDRNGNFIKEPKFIIKANANEVYFADIDNDGDIDIYEVCTTIADRIWLNDGEGAFTLSSNRPDVKSGGDHTFLVDADSDGDMDIYESHDTHDKIWLNDGKGAFPQTLELWMKQNKSTSSGIEMTWNTHAKEQGQVAFYDLDGDGQNELFMIVEIGSLNKSYMADVYTREGDQYVLLHENVTQKDFSDTFGGMIGINALRQVVDLNGDGVPDFIYIGYCSYCGLDPDMKKPSAVTISDGAGGWTTSQIDVSAALKERRQLVDINADGAPDIVYIDHDGHDFVMLNDGKGNFAPAAQELHLNGSLISNDFIDIDGDGAVDVMNKSSNAVYDENSSSFTVGDGQVHLNDGIGILDTVTVPIKFSYDDDEEHYNALYGDFNADGMIDVLDTRKGLYYNDTPHEKIIQVTDSFKNITKITYASLSDESVYTKGDDAKINEVDLRLAQEVVSQTSVGDGIGGEHLKRYHYSGLKYHRFRGSLGFSKIEETDVATGGRIVTHYEQSYPLTGRVYKTETFLGEELLGEQTVSFNLHVPEGISDVERDGLLFEADVEMTEIGSGNTPYLIEQSSKKQTHYMDNTLLKTVETGYLGYDGYGNVLNLKSVTTDHITGQTFTKTTTSSYENREEEWILGRLLSAEVKHEGYDSEITRKSAFTYNTQGMLESETIEPEHTLALIKSYTYDDYGNKLTETLFAPSLDEPRTTEYTYDDDFRFITTVKNALGHEEHRAYDPVSGELLSITGPNGLTTRFEYNTWDQKTKELRADGTSTSWEYTYDDSINNSHYAITKKDSSGAEASVYHDSFDREAATRSVGFDGQDIFIETVYNHKGQKEKKSSPYKAGEEKSYIIYTYDEYGRTIKTETPAFEGQTATTAVAYDGYKVTTTDAEGRTKTIIKNAMDKVVYIQEGESSTRYDYDAVGNLRKTVPNDDESHAITMEYDILGNKIAMDDPNMGHWSYTYDALGKLTSQTDAKLQTVTIAYDTLGRVVSKTTPEGVHTWQYDTGDKAIGKVVHEQSADGAFKKSYTYGDFGRVDSITTVIDGKSYTENYAYNDKGQLSSVTKPDNFELINVYNTYGYLEAIKSPARRITDFDFDHYRNLITQQLQDALEYHKKYLEYQSEAARLRAQADYYLEVAQQAQEDRQFLEDSAAQLRELADQYTYYATLNKGYADDAKAQADEYQALADQYANNILFTQQAEQYQQLADEYYTYEQEYRALTAEYLQQAQEALQEAQNYDDLAQSSAQVAEACLDAVEQINTWLSTTQQHSAYYKQLSDQTEDARNLSEAYNEVLSDAEYRYHYKVLKVDSYGRVTKYLSGNGLINTDIYDNSGAMLSSHTGFYGDNAIRDLSYTYDLTYNVTERKDTYLGVTAYYAYDSLSRIENANFTFENEQGITGLDNMNYAYDAFGNLTYKSDIGDYEYDMEHPNRLARVTNPETGAVKTFDHDANGNMVYNDGIVIEYNSANKATRIKDGGADIFFEYDMHDKRYKKTDGSRVTHYVGKSYEYIDNGNGNTVHRHLIYANGKVVAINTETYQPDNAVLIASIRYLHYDALGSVDTITDNKGTVIERRAYKPFGEELKVYKSAEAGETTNRGFTGHEHINGTRLIHMNARLYDPTLGRFLSADTIIPDPYDTQAFNRYSYVRNNPLKYTDPSGHSWLSKIFKVVVAVVLAAVASYYVLTQLYSVEGATGFINTFKAVKAAAIAGKSGALQALIGAGAAGGFAGGFSSALLNGANFGQALIMGAQGAIAGSISAGVAFQIGHMIPGIKDYVITRAVAHGLTRGIITRVQGGKWNAGFWSGFASSVLGYVTEGIDGNVGLAVQALVGGTVSQISGGKFANGAVSAAVVYLFNEMTKASEDPEFQYLMKQTNNAVMNGKPSPFMPNKTVMGDPLAKAISSENTAALAGGASALLSKSSNPYAQALSRSLAVVSTVSTYNAYLLRLEAGENVNYGEVVVNVALAATRVSNDDIIEFLYDNLYMEGAKYISDPNSYKFELWNQE